uniref:Signal recognition particle 19 kDa protein n=1 Tax=Haplochromis burtoni TaxID=8153 RepID=A0A3Q2WHB2_HAPBU
MAHLTQNPADKERFVCLYPIYINSKKTLAEGRRISVEKAVENPSCTEIRDVLAAAGMNVYMENKIHPREWNRDGQFKGRVRVQIKQADGSPCQEKFSSRECFYFERTLLHVDDISRGKGVPFVVIAGKDVMIYVAEMIPKLKTRTQKSGGGDTSSQQGEGGKKSKKKKK